MSCALFLFSCFYSLALVSIFPLNNVWPFEMRSIFDHPFCPVTCSWLARLLSLSYLIFFVILIVLSTQTSSAVLSLTTRPHLPLLRPRIFIYRHATVISILTLSIMRTQLNTGTHTDMPTGIRKGRTSLWGLNLPLRVVLMDPKKGHFLWISTLWYDLDLEGGFVTLGAVV